MTAEEARTKAAKQAEILRERNATEAERKAEIEAKKRAANHKKWQADFEKTIRGMIQTSVEYGHNEITYTLSEADDWSSKLYGKEKFFQNYEYAKEIRDVILNLEADGYA